MSKIKIFGAQLTSLFEIFQDRLFTIPDYQRSYAWDDRQVEELLKDIGHLIDDVSTHRHYTGTLVLSKATAMKNEQEFHVVDGQQRLTTLVIILSVLVNFLAKKDQPAFAERYLRRGEIGSDRTVLRLNSDTRQFFERVIMDRGHPNNETMHLEAHERLLKARKLISTWVEERIKAGTTVEQICGTLENDLGFLIYAPKEEAETGIMFEVINNRGKALSELEKVKNYLIYCSVKLRAPSVRESIDKNWSDILRDLNVAKKTSPGDEGAFLRYCMVVYFRLNKTDSQYGYDELKKKLVIEAAVEDQQHKQVVLMEICAFVDFIKQAALWYKRLYGQQREGFQRELKTVLEQIRGQDRHASIMPIFLALVIRNEEQGKPLIRLLSVLERINFRVYMARNVTKRNDTGQGDLYAYAAAYFHKELLQEIPENERKFHGFQLEDDHQALEYLMVKFALWHAPDSVLEASLQLEKDSTDDFFHWGGLRYFLMNYEQDLQPNKTIQIDKITMARSEGKSADFLSVEHRWATENRSADGENNRAIDKFEKRRLGNFVLLELRLNIQAGKENLEDKIKHYLGNKGDEPPTDLEQVRRMVKDSKDVLKTMNDWTRSKNYHLELHRTINNLTEARLKKFTLKRWSLNDCIGFSELKKRSDQQWTEDV